MKSALPRLLTLSQFSRRMQLPLKAVAFSFLLLGTNLSEGETLTYSIRSGGSTEWPWDLPEFDPSLGTLDSISIDLTCKLLLDIGLTSRNDYPTTITLDLDYSYGCVFPAFGNVGVHDHGTSSTTLTPESPGGGVWFTTNLTASSTFPASGLYIGTGTLHLQPVGGLQNVSVTGPGDWIVTQAYGYDFYRGFDLHYNYTIPEPSTLTLTTFGAVALIICRRRS